MTRLAQTEDLTDIQSDILAAVHDFVEKEIIPNANTLEHADEYPTEIVEGLKELGVFGLMIPEEYGGLGESLTTYALVVRRNRAGWMSVSGSSTPTSSWRTWSCSTAPRNRSSTTCPAWPPARYGRLLDVRTGMGSDVAAIQSKAVREGDEYVLNGQKMWLTNGGSSTLVAVLVLTPDEADPDASVYKKMTTFLIEKPEGFGEVLPGLTIPGKIDKMGYKGVDTTELIMDNFHLPADAVLGGEPGKGFYQMMDGVEVGRVNVAARACGWRSERSNSAPSTPNCGRPSESPSHSIRRSCSAWPTWPSRSRRLIA